MHKPNGSFRKVFAAGLAITTAMWTLAALAVVPVATAAVEAHPAGTLVLSGGTVWKISDDGSSRVGFDTPERFWSSRYSFDQVVPANSADLALPDGGLAPWGSGVLFNDSGTIFMVAGGVKRGFSSATAFTGQGFSFDQTVEGDISVLPEGAIISSPTQTHPEGTFVLDNGTVWYITATGRMGLSQPGVLFSHGGSFDRLVPANAADMALANEGNMNFRTGTLVNDNGTIWAVQGNIKRGFPSASCYTGFGFTFDTPIVGSVATYTQGDDFCQDGGTTPTPSTGTLTVSLAGDTPAATTVVKNAARVGFTKVNFTATGGDVVIDNIEVERVGVSLDSNFSSIILLDVSNNTSVSQASQLGNEKTLNSTHKATFNQDITVKNGTTKSILVAGNMASTVQAADQAALRVNSVQVSGTGTVVGALPLTGNTMTMNNNVTISTATFTAGGSNPSATTQNVGTNDYVLSSVKLTNGSQEKVEVHSMKFTQNGSVADADVVNLELLVDGSVVATVSQATNKEVVFVFNTPIVLDKGNNKEFVLRGDIASGSARTISFDIEDQADVVVKGQTYGFFILPTYPNTTSPYFNANDTTVGDGSVTFSKGVISTLNVAEGGNGQVLGAFKTTVQGEAVRVTQFVMGVSVSGTGNAQDVSNLVVKDSNGTVVAGPTDPDTGVTARDTATTTDTIIFPVGTNTYTIEGDLNSDFANGDTIQIDLPDPDGLFTVKGEITNNTITPGPTSDLSLDTVTVKTAGLNVSASPSPVSQSVIVGASQHHFASFVFDASASGEDVRVTQLAVAHKTSANSIQTNIANLTLYNGSTALSPVKQPTAVAAQTATTTFSLTNPIVIPKGGTATIDVKGDIVTGTADQTHQFACNGGCVTAVGVNTGNSVTSSITNNDGPTMTIAASGSLTVSTDASNPDAALLTGGSSMVTVGELLLSANNEDADLTDIHFTATAVNGGALNDEFSRIYLFDGSTQIASRVPTTSAAITFENIDGLFVITKGTSGKRLTVKADVAQVSNPANPGVGPADAGDGVSLAVAEDAYAARGVSSGSALAAGSKSGTYTGNAFTVYRSVPTVAAVTLPASSLANGTQVLNKFKVTADAKGDIGLYSFSFAISTTTATVTNFKLYEEPGTTAEDDLTSDGAKAVDTIWVASSGGSGGVYGLNLTFEDNDSDAIGKELRQITAGSSKTYELRGTVSLGGSTSGSVQVNLLGDNAFSSGYPSAAETVNAEEQGKFVWSDLHYGNTSSTATNTAEWFNGYRVTGLTSTNTAQQLIK